MDTWFDTGEKMRQLNRIQEKQGKDNAFYDWLDGLAFQLNSSSSTAASEKKQKIVLKLNSKFLAVYTTEHWLHELRNRQKRHFSKPIFL